MNLKDYRRVLVAGSLVLMLIAVTPTLGLVVQLPRGGERFSELWVLDQNQMAMDYPLTIAVNQTYRVFVGVGNHMGSSSYYLIYAKFRNENQPLPNETSSEPSPLPPLFEFRAFVADEGTWQAPLTFRILEASRNDDSMVVGRLSINDEVVTVNASATWDSEFKGFYYQLFFELWLYNVTSESFQFHDRFIGIWLNMSG